MKNTTIKSRIFRFKWLSGLALSVFFFCGFQILKAQCPVATSTPSAQTICSSTDTTAILLTSSVTGTTFSWTPIETGVSGATTGNGDSITQIISLTGNSDGTVVYTITPTANGCIGASINVTITLSMCYSVVYSSTGYCQAGLNPTPLVYSSGGVFSSTPMGLSIDSNSGTIDLASSIIGTYTIIYTNGSNSDSTTVTVVGPSANFSYLYSVYCQNANNPSPIFDPGASAGVFSSSPAGLVFVHINTGGIDLASSTPGTYTVTDSVSSNGGCPAVGATTTITINSMDDASFTYSSAIYSQTGIDPTPQITGVQGGSFSSTPFGLAINPATGLINLANCSLGTYTVAYTTNGTCPNTSFLNITITATVSINENKSSGTLSVYPNPGNGMYYVKLPEGMKNSEMSIKVYNLLGELILTTKMQNSSSQIDLSHQPDGIYIIKVNDFNPSFILRLIKQK